MRTHEVIHALTRLVEHDLAAIDAFDQAIAQVGIVAIRSRLEDFRAHHQAHALLLEEVMAQMGSRDAKREHDQPVRGAAGLAAALRTLRMNEEIVNRCYDDCCQGELPTEVRAIVERMRNDERRHLAFIERALEELEAIRPEGSRALSP